MHPVVFYLLQLHAARIIDLETSILFAAHSSLSASTLRMSAVMNRVYSTISSALCDRRQQLHSSARFCSYSTHNPLIDRVGLNVSISTLSELTPCPSLINVQR